MRITSSQLSNVLGSKSVSPGMDACMQSSHCARHGNLALNSRTLRQSLPNHPGVARHGKSSCLKRRGMLDCEASAAHALPSPRLCCIRTELFHGRRRYQSSALASLSLRWQSRVCDRVLRRQEKRKCISPFGSGSRYPFVSAIDIAKIGAVYDVLASNSSDSDTTRSLTKEEHGEFLERLYDERGVIFADEVWENEEQDEGQGDGENAARLPEELEKKYTAILEAGQVQSDCSQVLIYGGNRAFVQRLCDDVRPKGLTVIHMSLPVLAAIKEMNDDVDCWHGSLDNYSTTDVKFDVVFLHSTVTAAYSLQNLFRSVVSLCNPGARIVLSSVHGREKLMLRGAENSDFVAFELPPEALLQEEINSMPLRVLKIQDDPHFYLAALEQRFPMRGTSQVVRGLGRGSSKMGIPTANLDPPNLSKEIRELSKGVYFGYARRCGSDSNAGVYKMVMNKGIRPTFGDSEDVTVEIHILHKFDADFYGEEMNIILLGFIREELKFRSMDDLLARIATDIKITETSLARYELTSYAADSSLFEGSGEI